jgi:DNA-binding PadR family transcriptional regulator
MPRRILAALLAGGGSWSHGYELARLADVKSGTLYPLLIRLEEQGYLEAEWQQPAERGRPARHAYRIDRKRHEARPRQPTRPAPARQPRRGEATT